MLQVLFLCFDKMNPGACLLFRGYIPGICLWALLSSVFSQIAGLIKINFYVDLLRKRMLIFLLNGLRDITKMAAYTIFGKNLNNCFLSKSPMTLTFTMRHQGLELYKAFINIDTGFTFSETIGPLEAKLPVEPP